VTPSGLSGGEYSPLPASKGLAFPSRLALDGSPTAPASFAQGQKGSLKIQNPLFLYSHPAIFSAIPQAKLKNLPPFFVFGGRVILFTK